MSPLLITTARVGFVHLRMGSIVQGNYLMVPDGPFCSAYFLWTKIGFWLVKVTAYRDRLSFLTSYKLKIRIILFAWIDMLIETVSYLKVGSGIARLNKKENYLGTCCRVFNQCSSVASIIHMSKCLLLHPQPTLTGIRKRLYSPFPFIQKFGIFIT